MAKKTIPSVISETSAAAAFIKKTETQKTEATKPKTKKTEPRLKPKATKPKTKKETPKKKLPAREIERMKTDFDPPRGAVDPGQTELFSENEQKAKKHKQMGQPRKYNEELKRISFALPVSAVEKLEALAAIHKINKTQFLLTMIETAASANAAKIEKYKKL